MRTYLSKFNFQLIPLIFEGLSENGRKYKNGRAGVKPLPCTDHSTALDCAVFKICMRKYIIP